MAGTSAYDFLAFLPNTRDGIFVKSDFPRGTLAGDSSSPVPLSRKARRENWVVSQAREGYEIVDDSAL